MKTEIKDNEIIIKMEARIDSANCQSFENEVFDILKDHACEKIVFDSAELDYISSAGLRVLLKIKKSGYTTEIINVKSQVYEIFEVTGFTEILDVKKVLRFVSVKDLEVIGKGGHGHVYRIDNETIVKVYHDNSPQEVIDRERVNVKNAFVQGISCPIAFDVVNTEEGLGVVLELVGAKTLSSFIMENPDKLDEYSVKFGQLIKKIGSTTLNISGADNIADIYRHRIELGKPYFTDEEYNICIRMLEAIEPRNTMIHGDLHPNNVMITSDGELVLIDMADISSGNPVFDIGGCYTSMIQSGLKSPDMTLAVVGIDYEKSKRMYDICIRTYFDTADEQTIELIKNRLAAFGAFRGVATLGVNSERLNMYRGLILEQARENFFPNAENIIKLLGMEFD